MAQPTSRYDRAPRIVGVLLPILVLVAGASQFASVVPAHAQATSTGAGGQTLMVSATTELDPTGASVTVTGSGYDTGKGIYVSFCVVPPPGELPTPCGGGIDLTGTGGGTVWISSHPPAYAPGPDHPVRPGGSFSSADDARGGAQRHHRLPSRRLRRRDAQRPHPIRGPVPGRVRAGDLLGRPPVDHPCGSPGRRSRPRRRCRPRPCPPPTRRPAVVPRPRSWTPTPSTPSRRPKPRAAGDRALGRRPRRHGHGRDAASCPSTSTARSRRSCSASAWVTTSSVATPPRPSTRPGTCRSSRPPARTCPRRPSWSLDPSVVLADDSIGPPEVLQQLRDSGIPVVMLPSLQTLDGVSDHIRSIAAALGVPDAGEQLVARVEQQIAAAEAGVAVACDTPVDRVPVHPRIGRRLPHHGRRRRTGRDDRGHRRRRRRRAARHQRLQAHHQRGAHRRRPGRHPHPDRQPEVGGRQSTACSSCRASPRHPPASTGVSSTWMTECCSTLVPARVPPSTALAKAVYQPCG